MVKKDTITSKKIDKIESIGGGEKVINGFIDNSSNTLNSNNDVVKNKPLTKPIPSENKKINYQASKFDYKEIPIEEIQLSPNKIKKFKNIEVSDKNKSEEVPLIDLTEEQKNISLESNNIKIKDYK